jgi:hypothetical protein
MNPIIQDDIARRRRTIIAVVIAAIIFIGIILLVIFALVNKQDGAPPPPITLSNPEGIQSGDLPDSSLVVINNNLSRMATHNGCTIDTGDAIIREGSLVRIEEGSNTKETFIVDIEKCRQSFAVEYVWQTNNPEEAAPGESVNVACPTPQQLIYESFDCYSMNEPTPADMLENCRPNDSTPGYIGWSNVKTSGASVLSATDTTNIESALTRAIQSRNQSITDTDKRTACVYAINTDSARPIETNPSPQSVTITTFDVRFIANDASTTTHHITYTIDTNTSSPYDRFTTIVTLDGEEI